MRAQGAPVGGPGTAGIQHLWKRRAFFLALAAILLCALFLPLQIKTWGLQSELNQLQNKKQALLLQQQQIQQQIGYYSSDAYVEEAARQDLAGETRRGPGAAGRSRGDQAVAEDQSHRYHGPLRRLGHFSGWWGKTSATPSPGGSRQARFYFFQRLTANCQRPLLGAAST